MNDNNLPVLAKTGQTDIVPTRPKNVGDEENQVFVVQAQSIVQQLQTNTDNRELMYSIGYTGLQAQKSARHEIGLYQARLGELIRNVEDGGRIPQTLGELNTQLRRISPHSISEGGGFVRYLNRIPLVKYLFRWLLPTAKEVLKTIGGRFDTVSEEIDGIEESLMQARDTLHKDNIEADKLYRSLQQRRFGVEKNAYLCELLYVRLSELHGSLSDPEDKRKVMHVMQLAGKRAFDLRLNAQAFTQNFIEIDMSVQANQDLDLVILNEIMTTIPVIESSIGVLVMQYRQRAVAMMAKKSRDFAAETMVKTARMVDENATQIAELVSQPSLALDKVKEAYDTLIKALDKGEDARKKALETAKRGIGQITGMTQELDKRAEALRGELKTTSGPIPTSIEAA